MVKKESGKKTTAFAKKTSGQQAHSITMKILKLEAAMKHRIVRSPNPERVRTGLVKQLSSMLSRMERAPLTKETPPAR